ncbi:natural killer cells antigen CD94-like [Pteropus medius]|uniref:natural killer cells antigen CD94-like n=1 Tax=Pteropus vampyrus TaxID=132908 RepID=UPI00196AC466|nr:natural killer cells antigen CD94-like [Pteropus giganteus]
MAGFQTIPWRLISGVLGVMCLVLMATLGMLWKNSFTKPSIQPTPSPGPNLEPQKDSSCQKMWTGYQCNCYFISNETKTWEESKDFCASKNSRLLQLQNEDELDFMNHIRRWYYWIGLSYNKERSAWLWEDGSALSQTLFSFPQTVNIQNCIVYSPNKRFLNEPCRKEMRFICKQLI